MFPVQMRTPNTQQLVYTAASYVALQSGFLQSHPTQSNSVTFSRPNVRDTLIQDRTITYQAYSDAFAPSMSLNSPFSDDEIILERIGPDAVTKMYQIHPAFEEHVRNLSNWTVEATNGAFWRAYPKLGKAVEQSRSDYGRPQRPRDLSR